MEIKTDSAEKGMLYLVSTPIGNLEDITLRALRILKEVDLVAAEDTRQTLKLLNHFEIKKPLVSYYEHNKIEKGNQLIRQMLEGKNIALVSDAGTPGISDPGEDLVRLAIENGIEVTAVPGPVAAVTGLITSGLPTGRFVFEGFLPMNKRVRKEHLKNLVGETRTIIFYEAPHKLIYTLKDLYEVLGNRRIVLARELTKRFEEKLRMTLEEAIRKYEEESPKGEFVLILEGASEEELKQQQRNKWEDMGIAEHVEMYMEQGMSKKEAMKKAAEDRGISKRDIYNSLL
ncbi:16S rRNA (cytidine(1402)-2'-O)-methyltransferase [Clostridium thermosuccinogenes]|uniref:Ribosomal RNA small subunit methyltransferase I n=1 Tax=Clostridium thermosuccinogenes TaxID=84032 RepID=A0A2K2EYA1_9CLOT|nr:16S rRNA (cytidine(1402)-2'-O)-methyltransferase [Pseudoclostridium thermosuccinogenes]AUS95143.1 16S rRNA (cytidine(1402)-2'-O)-methyltransferase [Pseudoclostridium thermosuccinogenes]PNT91505.1 16S rRNA (cytidine(1402)-2'-O)-methyltransferase [Pseudoclostridium thermosuccinogenes]PNT99137.1 16S rRNA (cytidine(1402)-2'-O)-methyltransferase [Pseudoclostridium thermosuccinogenes]PNU00941.1 16S rRNA (cytidine(1402)-2'-O)-methyltransferase [Pseudoclostridium thermosuccinogenes]